MLIDNWELRTMVREISCPSTARCPHLSEVMNISHDSANRFLHRETYSPQDLFKEATTGLNLKGGLLSVDDSVPDKPHSYKMALSGISGRANTTKRSREST